MPSRSWKPSSPVDAEEIVKIDVGTIWKMKFHIPDRSLVEFLTKLLTTLSAEEMFSVPGLVERCYAFLGEKKVLKFKIPRIPSIFLHPKSAHCSRRTAG